MELCNVGQTISAAVKADRSHLWGRHESHGKAWPQDKMALDHRFRLAICFQFWLATAWESVSRNSAVSWLRKMKGQESEMPKLEGHGVCDSGKFKRNGSNDAKQTAESVQTLFLMLRARFAYFRVFKVSTKSQSDGDIHAIIVVWLLYNDQYNALVKVSNSLLRTDKHRVLQRAWKIR